MTDKNKPEVEGEVCECGHVKEKHRDRGSHSCLRCDCRRYAPAELLSDGRIIPQAHPPGCLCGRCAWERLYKSEAMCLNLNKRLKEVEEQNKRFLELFKKYNIRILECAHGINSLINVETAPMFKKKEVILNLKHISTTPPTPSLPSWIVNGVCKKPAETICNLGYACDGCPYLPKEAPKPSAQPDLQAPTTPP